MVSKMITRIIILCLFMLTTFSSLADTISSNDQVPTKQIVPSDLPINKNLEEQAKLYKLLYENSKSSNERLVFSINLIIGTVVTFLLALFGAQLFFNFKLKTEEISKINSELNEKLSNSNADLNEKLSYSNAEIVKQINLLNSESNKALRLELEASEKQIDRNVSVRFSDEEKLRNSELERLKQQIEFLNTSFDREIKRINIDLEKTIGDVWGLKGVKSNLLTKYIKTAMLEFEIGQENEHTIRDIVKQLNELPKLHETDKSQLEKLLAILPARFESSKDAIISKINSLEIYKFVDDPLNPGKRISKTIKEATA
jgi:hypothetical protein